jgi:hypothetical protein
MNQMPCVYAPDPAAHDRRFRRLRGVSLPHRETAARADRLLAGRVIAGLPERPRGASRALDLSRRIVQAGGMSGAPGRTIAGHGQGWLA